jgi:hypothetical protein
MNKLLLLALLVIVAQVIAEPLAADRVHLIDHNPSTNNFLFRGNMPVNSSGVLDYGLWRDTLIRRAKEEFNVDVPSDFYIIDYSFLYTVLEPFDLSREKNFFEANPQLGEFRHYPLWGTLANANLLSESLIKLGLKSGLWNNDKLGDLVAETKRILDTKADKPVVVYYHCEHGVDRTGEGSGAYYMTHLQWTYAKTIDYNFNIIPRHMNFENTLELNWYCWHLHYTQGFPNDCDSRGI